MMAIETEHTEQLFTLKDVSNILKIGMERVYNLIDKGELDAFCLDDEDPFSRRAWRISARSLNDLLENRKIHGNGANNDRYNSNA